MYVAKYSRVIVSFCFFLVLVSCGGGGDSGSNPLALTSINDFKVTGTSVGTGPSVPINANINNGEFNVSWDVSSSDPYHVKVYVSEDATYSDSDDIDFLGKNCGTGSFFYQCTQTGSFDCTFTSTNLISSCTPSSVNRDVNISRILNTTPKTAYLILRACNGLLTSCKEQAVQVEFQ